MISERPSTFMALALISLATLFIRPSHAAMITVTNLDDNGSGSLRDVIAHASSGDTVVFDPSLTSTIVLTSGGLIIDKNLTLIGGPQPIALDGNQAATVLTITEKATVKLSALTIQNGKGSEAGGIYNEGTLNIANSTIVGNSGSKQFFDGVGGIFNYGQLQLINSTVANNHGLGIQNISLVSERSTINDIGVLQVVNSTIVGNDGGIANNGFRGVFLSNSIIAGNSGSGHADVMGIAFSRDYNLIQNAYWPSIADAVGHNILGQDPRLGPLQNNGGPTNTMALLRGSPAIDQILNSACAGLTDDQRGYQRPVNELCDIGAFEYNSSLETPTPTITPTLNPNGTLVVTNLNDRGPGSLRDAVANASAGSVIKFKPDLTGTITLALATLTIDKNLTIVGGPEPIVLDGNHAGTVVAIDKDATVSLSNLTIQNGMTSQLAGGIFNKGTLTLTGCTVAHNHAYEAGGGIVNYGRLTVINSTIADNFAGFRGGGIFNGGTLTVINSTIAYNGTTQQAGRGGGVLSNPGNGIFNLANSIVARNLGSNLGGPVHSLDYNIIPSTAASIVTGTIDHNDTNDPELGPLQYNGGPTYTIALLPGSAALDRIPPSSCAHLTTDQRGYGRPINNFCDIGAFERSPSDPIPASTLIPGITATSAITQIP